MTEILVDGSNVLFWRGGQVQREVPALVVQALIARRFVPLVYFDHSIHRHLDAQGFSALEEMGEVCIAPSGTTADEMLLGACGEGRIQIVSCDRFEAWRKNYPKLRRDWCVSGRIGKGGRVSFSKTLRRAAL